MTEERLSQLQNALKSVAEQMDILKTKINVMDTEQPKPRRNQSLRKPNLFRKTPIS